MTASDGGSSNAIGWELLERCVVARDDATASGDLIMVGRRWVGVVDQSTPKTPGETDLSRALQAALAEIDRDGGLSASDVIRVISNHVGREQPASRKACATVALLDSHQRRVIRVGDCHVAVGETLFNGSNPVDEILGPMRSLVDELQHLGGGTDGTSGRAAILPWILETAILRNHPTSPLAYGAIDGSVIPARFIEEIPIGEGETTVTLSTDGYPRAATCLSDAEADLGAMLTAAPRLLPTTKTPQGPGSSFDDRAFVSVRLRALT